MNRANAKSNSIKRNEFEAYASERRPIMNFSDLIEDKTIHVEKSSISSSPPFEPNEISGRSTGTALTEDVDCDQFSVDDILGASFVQEIRHITKQCDRQSLQINRPTSNSSVNSFTWNRSKLPNPPTYSDSLTDECFEPAEKMKSALEQDEKEWANEYADIPLNEESHKKISPIDLKRKQLGKLVNLTEFSGFLADLSPTPSDSEMSIGRYFSKRCDTFHDPIHQSPTKKSNAPIGLFNEYSSRNTSAYASSKNHSEASSAQVNAAKYLELPKVNNATYDKKADDSIMSVSTIATKLSEDYDSPKTFLNKLYAKKSKPLTTHNLKVFDETHKQQLAPPPPPSPSRPSLNPNRIENKENHDINTESDDGIGMLIRMNSTAINEEMNEEKIENQNELDIVNESQWRQNKSVGTNSTLSAANSAYESSFYSSCNVPTNRRQRSETPPSSTADTSIGQIDLTNLQLNSPNRKNQPKAKSIINPIDTNENQNQNQQTNEMDPKRKISRFDPSHYQNVKHSLPANFGGSPTSHLMNFAPALVHPRSSSQLSNSSEFTQNDGKLPLKSNQSHLSWECVKLRKSIIKSFIVKNSSDKKLILKMDVVGPGFQIAATNTEKEQLILRGSECRTINVTFCPTTIGKAIGRVIFKPLRNWSDGTERSIHLYGYGGCTSLQLRGIERAPVGDSFLKLGETGNIRSTTLTRTFSIYNKGPLNGVATIFVKPKSNQYISESHINIEPNKCAIRADSSVDIKVTYKLRRKDLECLTQKSCEVLTVSSLEVILGAEPNRQRIAAMLTNSSIIPQKYKQLEFLINNFPIAKHEHFHDFNEHMDNVTELFNCFKTTDIALTINRTAVDESRDSYQDLSGIDDTILFRTIIETPASNNGTTKEFCPTISSSTQVQDQKALSVQPTRLIMDPILNSRKTITIQNNSVRSQTFQIDSTHRGFLNFSNDSGRIEPNQIFDVVVEFKTGLRIMPCDGIINVYVENDCVEIPVIIRAAF